MGVRKLGEVKMSELTRKAIISTFYDILSKKQLSKITVKEIAERCGINRMTFYYHFKDIYDLAETSLEEKLTDVFSSEINYGNWRENYLSIYLYVESVKGVLRNMIPNLEKRRIEEYLNGIGKKIILQIISEKSTDKICSEEDKGFIADVFRHCFTGMLLEWVENGMKEDPKVYVAKICRIMQGTIDNAIEKCGGS